MSLDVTSPRQRQVNEGERGDARFISNGSRDSAFRSLSASQEIPSPSAARFVQRYFERLSRAFYSALENAQGKGELRLPVEPRAEAGFLTASVLGMFVMLRAKAPPTVIKGAVRVAIEHLEALRVEQSS
jgi:hypothetical protein